MQLALGTAFRFLSVASPWARLVMEILRAGEGGRKTGIRRREAGLAGPAKRWGVQAETVESADSKAAVVLLAAVGAGG